MLELRPYQEESVDGLFGFFRTNVTGNPVIALPTGTGKSVVIAEFVRRAVTWYPQTRILVVTHVKELVQQNHAELVSLWPTAPAGIYSAGLKRRDVRSPVTFCGIGSIAKRVQEFGHIDLVIIDECHMVSHKNDTMYAQAILALRSINPHLRVIGLSASPFRLGVGMITDGGLFTDICVDYCTLEKFNALVDAGYISPLIPKKTETELNVDSVDIHGGEYVLSQLQDIVDQECNTRPALEETLALARGRCSFLVFTTGVKHTRHVVAELNRMGTPALGVHSQMEPGLDIGTRDDNIRHFKAGNVAALVNYGVLTTGFNHKPIDCIVILRPTMSPGLWVQMLGRGTRPYDFRTERDVTLRNAFPIVKQNCLVLDFAANTRRLGPINDPVIPKKKGKKGTGMAPYKVCPHCMTYNHARARFCIECKAEFPQRPDILDTKAATEELIRKERLLKPEQPPEPLVIEEFPVTRVEYHRHESRDRTKPPSLKVTYFCGLRIFTEWLNFEHTERFVRHKARDAWRLMETAATGQCGDPPETIDEALARLDQLRPPSAIRVLLKSKWPDVVGYEFSDQSRLHLLSDGVTFAEAEDI